jgi:hypothetical protein
LKRQPEPEQIPYTGTHSINNPFETQQATEIINSYTFLYGEDRLAGLMRSMLAEGVFLKQYIQWLRDENIRVEEMYDKKLTELEEKVSEIPIKTPKRKKGS